MGEYATIKRTGERIKIGTCEDLFDLRWDQAHLVRREDGPWDDAALAAYRFRFPFPDEDHIQPGQFTDVDRGVPIHGLPQPEMDHDRVQFVASSAGYNLTIPCPEGQPGCTPGWNTKVGDLTVHRNGFSGPMIVVQQRWWRGRLVTVCRCRPCGVTYRLETIEAAQPVIDHLRKEADGRGAGWYRTMADRIEAGYSTTL